MTIDGLKYLENIVKIFHLNMAILVNILKAVNNIVQIKIFAKYC